MNSRMSLRRSLVTGLALIFAGAGPVLIAQEPVQSDTQPPAAETLSPQQLDNLVAPIALYSDPLLTQVLVACTYPLEIVEAQQWLQANHGLNGAALIDAARQQNWDASVQALVAFPDVLAKLNQDVHWTAGLGNAFLAQQADVMSAVQRIEVLANIDELTGLENRRAIMKSLVEQIALCDRTGLPMSIAILDIDHFKKINDVYGHLAGDRALQLFTERAAGTIRTTDKLGRYGGEEFLLVLVATGLRDAGDALTRIRARIAGWDWSAIDPSLRVTITIGATEYVKGDSVEDLIRRADAALYLGKASGRDRVVLDHGAIQGRPLREIAAVPV